jgi:ketosteroid isomerase-like protein
MHLKPFADRRAPWSFVMSKSPNSADISANSEIPDLHRKRGDALLHREADRYLAFHWDDAVLFIFDHRMTFDEMRRRLPLLAAGSEAITVELPPADGLIISESGDAATTSFQWRTRIRNSKGVLFDRVNYETDVWYRRNGIWKVICMHLTNLASEPVN